MTSDRHDGKAFALTGPATADYHQAARLLSEVLGREIAYRHVAGEVFVAEQVANGLPEPYAQLLVAIFQAVVHGWTAVVTDAVETLSGKPPRSLATSIADLAGALKASAA